MQPEELQQHWKEQGEEALAAVAQWRVAHPKATLAEIEQAVDEQINRLRAQLIEQAAQASAAARVKPARDWCASSVVRLCKHADGRDGGGRRREVSRWKWNARMSVARNVEAGFFPLDKELQVPDGHLLPHAQEALVRLGSELPFGRVAEHLEGILGVVVHASTARRQTLAVWAAGLLEMQNEQAQPRAACPEEQASERMAMSSDGAMVPLVGGVWAEVKVVAIGAVERRTRKGEEQIVTTKLTYFARLANAATFADQASAEVRRRGIERAKEVCAIQDGAEWIQDFVQGHRHDALRILDLAHAADYVNEIADKVRDSGGHLPRQVGGRRLAPAQTRGASAGAAPSQPLSQALSADPRAGELLAEAARVDGLSDLPAAGLADWVWKRGKQP